VSVTGGHRVHLLTIPVERLVVAARLVDAASVPVARSRTTVVAMVTALWRAWSAAAPRICTGRSQTDAEQT
jgi:hypothetical protein